jgi:hypothetical protein
VTVPTTEDVVRMTEGEVAQYRIHPLVVGAGLRDRKWNRDKTCLQ